MCKRRRSIRNVRREADTTATYSGVVDVESTVRETTCRRDKSAYDRARSQRTGTSSGALGSSVCSGISLSIFANRFVALWLLASPRLASTTTAMSSNGLRSGFKKLIQSDNVTKNTVLTALAETIGTSMLVFLGCMGCVGSLGVVPSHFQVAMTFGLAVMIVIQSIGHISHAHINPAITVGAVVLGKKTIPEGLVYLLSQLTGAVIGYGMLKVVTPAERLTAKTVLEADSFCVTDLHADLTAIQGLLLEGIATGILMLIACAVWDSRNEKNTDSVPIRFGLAVAALALAFGPYTGCSMNPARSLAPAVWNNQWSHHWIYWFGPIGGSLLSSFMYKNLFGVKEMVEEESVPEALALNSVETQKAEP